MIDSTSEECIKDIKTDDIVSGEVHKQVLCIPTEYRYEGLLIAIYMDFLSLW